MVTLPPLGYLFSIFSDRFPTSNFVHLKFTILKLVENRISLEESTKVLIELDDNLPIWGGGCCLLKSAIQVERCD